MSFVGSQECCNRCEHDLPQPCWQEGALVLCRKHFEAQTGSPPPRPRTASDLPDEPAPPSSPRFHSIRRLDLRARRLSSGAVRIEHVRNVEALGTVADHIYELTPSEWLELVLNVSARAEGSDVDRELVRTELRRIHLGRQS